MEISPTGFLMRLVIKYSVRIKVPCKPLLGLSPELIQPKPSLRVVQRSIVWSHYMRGVCWRWKWEVLGRRGLSEAEITLAVPAWHRTVHRNVLHRLDGKIGKQNSKIRRLLQKDGPYCSRSTVQSDRLCTSLHLTLCIYRSSDVYGYGRPYSHV